MAGIPVVNGFNITNNAPVDERFVKADMTAALAIQAFNRYDGLQVYLVDEKKTYRFKGGIADADLKVDASSSPLISMTYADLMTLVGATSLEPGQAYLINDYATKHCILTKAGAAAISPAVMNTGPTAPIVVRAQTNALLEPIAFQPSNPKDIIYYDATLNVCEDGVTSRTGWITYRHDTNANVSCWYDWKVVKHRRWKINTTTHGAYNAGTTYARNALVVSGTTLYVSNVASNTGNTPGANSYWTPVLENVDTVYHLTATSIAMTDFTLSADTTAFKDFYTFHNSTADTCSTIVRATRIGKLDPSSFNAPTATTWNNIVVQMPNDTNTSTYVDKVIFEEGCYDMNFYLTTGQNNLIRSWFGPETFNVLARNVQLCQFWGGTSNLIMGTAPFRIVGQFSRTIIGNGCSLVSAQTSSSLRLVGGNSNVNIIGSMATSTIGQGTQRIFVFRPVGSVHLLLDSDATQIGSHNGNYTLLTGKMSSTDVEITCQFGLTFTGAAGAGAVGSLTLLDLFSVPAGFCIDKVTVRTTGLTYNATAALNLGFTGSTTAGLDNTTGAMALIGAGNSKTEPNTGSSGSDTNAIVMSVTGADITAGTAVFTIVLRKI